MEEKVLEFLKKQNPKLCVLSTASKDGKPESAVMGYAVKDNLTIILSTHKESRKWHNLKENQKVSLVTGWNFEIPNIQYDGIATLIEEGPKYPETEQFFFTQNLHAARFKSPDTIFIEVKPMWIRCTELSQTPHHVEEKTF